LKLTIRRTKRFKRDIKRVLRGGKEIEKILGIINILSKGQTLPPECKDHPLMGEYKGKCDCHIEPDWILIYSSRNNELVLYRTGSHSELFK